MSEYIEREKAEKLLVERLEETALNNTSYQCDAGVIYMDAADRLRLCWLKDIPAADVRPVVKAYWIGEGDGYADGKMVYDVWSCSNCGYNVDEGDNEPPQYNFCPNCGADMRGGEDNGQV